MENEYIKGYKTFEDFQKGYEEFIGKLTKLVDEPLEDFITEYELYREGIMNRYYNGILYKVNIELSEAGIEAGIMETLSNKPGFICSSENVATVLWPVPHHEGIYEIEIEMYYFLKQGEYGSYDVLECVLADFKMEIYERE